MRAAAIALAIAALVGAAGCGGDSPADGAVARLDDIRSGALDLRVAVTPAGRRDRFGFRIEGPFRFPEDGPPAASFVYTQTLGKARAQAHLLLDGGKGWIELEGDRRPLEQPQLDALRVERGEAGFLEGLDVERWFSGEPNTRERDGGGTIIEGDASPARTLEGLMRLAGGLGDARFELDEADEERLVRATRGSRLRIETGADDLMRRLHYDLALAFDVPRQLRAALGDVRGATLSFDLAIRSPNGDVRVRP